MDLDQLERLSQAVRDGRHLIGGREWARRVTPSTVLALIDRLRKAERVVEAADKLARKPGANDWSTDLGLLRDALDAYDREEADGGT